MSKQIRIDDEAHLAAKVAAAKANKPLHDWASEVLKEQANKPEPKPESAKPSK